MVSAPSERCCVLLKTIIVVLLIGVLVSLFSGLAFLFKDSDRQDSKRTLYALGLRITLAGALMIAVLYGLMTGQLRMGSNAPWHNRDTAPVTEPAAPRDAGLPDAGARSAPPQH
jgi:hypothetical protein